MNRSTRTHDPAVEAIQRELADYVAEPKSPYVPVKSPYAATGSPYVKPSPYQATSPYQAKSPYAVRSPYVARSPYQRHSPYGRKGSGTSPRRRQRVTRRYFFTSPPKQAPHFRWSTSLRYLMQATDYPDCPGLFLPGDGFDFDEEARCRAEWEHGEGFDCDECLDWDEYEKVADTHGHPIYAAPIREGERCYHCWADELNPFGGGGEAWDGALELWGEAREMVLADPQHALVATGSARFAAGLTGIDPIGDQDWARMLLDALDVDPSIRAALPDAAITYAGRSGAPAWPEFAQLVDGLSSALERLVEDHDCWLVDPACSQFFCFARLSGLHPGNSPDLSGKYVCRSASYHSLIEEPDPSAVDGLVGWREIEMVPCDDDWKPLE